MGALRELELPLLGACGGGGGDDAATSRDGPDDASDLGNEIWSAFSCRGLFLFCLT